MAKPEIIDKEAFFADQELSYQQLDDQWWDQFVKMMVNVLSNQPIWKPIPQVKLFTFTDATPRSVFLRLEFTEPIADRQGRSCTYFKVGNAFGPHLSDSA